MKKHGIYNAELICELTKMRHQDKIAICDVGLPIPPGKKVVDVSLVAGLPTVAQVFRAVCNEILLEAIIVPEMFVMFQEEFFGQIKAKCVNHDIVVVPNEQWADVAAAEDVKLYIRTGDNGRCVNMIVSSASGVPRHYDRLNVEFEDVING